MDLTHRTEVRNAHTWCGEPLLEPVTARADGVDMVDGKRVRWTVSTKYNCRACWCAKRDQLHAAARAAVRPAAVLLAAPEPEPALEAA